MKKSVLLIALIIVLGGCLQGGGEKTVSLESKAVATGNAVGQRAPDFSLVDINGKRLILSELRGSPTVVWFFAAWCTTCVPEAKALSKIHRNYAGKGVKVVRIDVWPGETMEDLKRFMRASGTIAEDGIWAFDRGEVAVSYGVRYLDTTFVIDRGGIITYRYEIPTDYSTLSRELEKVL